ncbi:predicted protein [Histoplasma capsulatum G186AR]|uniref:Uncharacterized protein n=1 Tax=Ajellomyces capsulatus (strain G186AR / H82 / ATCC MYA-2454 / RMSCC 2432) TaxID=447093 RepID=C0NP49_AJECG|nr:uncharacterized protein HCBG_04929 [Histoplasma capsulatum G186AR]EEH06709.1 predicted protein [Histoplasma capsulatum G186AR]
MGAGTTSRVLIPWYSRYGYGYCQSGRWHPFQALAAWAGISNTWYAGQLTGRRIRIRNVACTVQCVQRSSNDPTDEAGFKFSLRIIFSPEVTHPYAGTFFWERQGLYEDKAISIVGRSNLSSDDSFLVNYQQHAEDPLKSFD